MEPWHCYNDSPCPAARRVLIYNGQSVGDYYSRTVVDSSLVIEIKCVDRFSNEQKAQCIDYLKASGLTVCLLVNFQHARLEFKRIVKDFEAPSPLRPVFGTPQKDRNLPYAQKLPPSVQLFRSAAMLLTYRGELLNVAKDRATAAQV